MNCDARLQKALLRADQGDLDGAVEVLRDLLGQDIEPTERVRAGVILGDLLAECRENRAAQEALEEALDQVQLVGESADDLLDMELARARELLEQLT